MIGSPRHLPTLLLAIFVLFAVNSCSEKPVLKPEDAKLVFKGMSELLTYKKQAEVAVQQLRNAKESAPKIFKTGRQKYVKAWSQWNTWLDLIVTALENNQPIEELPALKETRENAAKATEEFLNYVKGGQGLGFMGFMATVVSAADIAKGLYNIGMGLYDEYTKRDAAAKKKFLQGLEKFKFREFDTIVGAE